MNVKFLSSEREACLSDVVIPRSFFKEWRKDCIQLLLPGMELGLFWSVTTYCTKSKGKGLHVARRVGTEEKEMFCFTLS